MEFPLISRELIVYLKPVHGLFNFTVACLFVYHGSCGLRIRTARRGNAPMPIILVRRHRKLGPVLAISGAAGFFVGLALTFIDTGDVTKYPAHLCAGAAIISLLVWTYLVSRKITAGENRWRVVHYRLGIAILLLYGVNLFLGVGVLL
jgi:hypothetical protein